MLEFWAARSTVATAYETSGRESAKAPPLGSTCLYTKLAKRAPDKRDPLVESQASSEFDSLVCFRIFIQFGFN